MRNRQVPDAVGKDGPVRRGAWVCSILLLACLCACAQAPAEAAPVDTAAGSEAETAAPAVPTPAVSPSPAASAPARQYGETAALVADANGFSGKMLYPQGGIQPVNRAVTDWVNETLHRLETESAALPPDENGMRLTMDIGYDAFLYKERFIGVQFAGTCRAAVSGKTEQIAHTYNYDLIRSRALTLSDVVRQTQIDEVARLVEERCWQSVVKTIAGGALTAASMQTFVLRDDGIEWLLLREDGGITGVRVEYAALLPYLCLEETDTAQVGGMAAGDEAVEQQATCLYDGAQVRTLPSQTEGDVIALLHAGETLDVLESDTVKGWHKILYNGSAAYIFAELVQLKESGEAYVTGWVNSAYLHVRSRAETESELLGTMQFCEPVKIVDAHAVNGWYKIWFEGAIAYVAAQYVAVQLYPPEVQSASCAPAGEDVFEEPRILRQTTADIIGVGACKTDGVMVHSAPYRKAASFGTLTQNEQVYILEEECAAGWDKVFVYTAWNCGYVGYVQAEYVSVAVPDAANMP